MAPSVLLSSLLAAWGGSRPSALRQTPVVGIYRSMPARVPEKEALHYYHAYQLWLEQFGVETVILPVEGDAAWYLEQTDALLLPGGPTWDAPPFATALVQQAVQANQQGHYYPVWGTCLGFEWLVALFGGSDALQVGAFNASNLPSNVTFTSDSPGRLFAAANASLLDWMATDEVVFENHADGIEPARFEGRPGLAGFFRALATGADREGKRYVTVVEGAAAPVYGVQFHPEKVRYTNTSEDVPRSPQAVSTSDFLAHFLATEAWKGLAARRHRQEPVQASIVFA